MATAQALSLQKMCWIPLSGRGASLPILWVMDLGGARLVVPGLSEGLGLEDPSPGRASLSLHGPFSSACGLFLG